MSDLLSEKLKVRKSNPEFPDFKLVQINEILDDIAYIKEQSQMDYQIISSNLFEDTKESNDDLKLF